MKNAALLTMLVAGLAVLGASSAGALLPQCDDDDPTTCDWANPSTWQCENFPRSDCDDGNACTDDECGEIGGDRCVHTNNANPCEDGDLCATSSDTCNSGVCVGGDPVDCDDGNPCTEDVCVPSWGVCAQWHRLPGPTNPGEGAFWPRSARSFLAGAGSCVWAIRPMDSRCLTDGEAG